MTVKSAVIDKSFSIMKEAEILQEFVYYLKLFMGWGLISAMKVACVSIIFFWGTHREAHFMI
jgi:hypothetical protein